MKPVTLPGSFQEWSSAPDAGYAPDAGHAGNGWSAAGPHIQ